MVLFSVETGEMNHGNGLQNDRVDCCEGWAHWDNSLCLLHAQIRAILHLFLTFSKASVVWLTFFCTPGGCIYNPWEHISFPPTSVPTLWCAWEFSSRYNILWLFLLGFSCAGVELVTMSQEGERAHQGWAKEPGGVGIRKLVRIALGEAPRLCGLNNRLCCSMAVATWSSRSMHPQGWFIWSAKGRSLCWRPPSLVCREPSSPMSLQSPPLCGVSSSPSPLLCSSSFPPPLLLVIPF